MPIEDIQVPKAPKGWSPTPDQQRRIASDPRLRNMSRDDLYLVFNKAPARSTAKPRQQEAPRRREPSGGLLGATLDRVTDAMTRRR